MTSIAFPKSPIRRIDVCVGVLVGVHDLGSWGYLIWFAFDHPARAGVTVRPAHSGTSVFGLVALLTSFLLLVVACLGVMRGRAWGFGSMVALMSLFMLGSLSRILISNRAAGGETWPVEGFSLAVLVYSLFRLRSLRRERIDKPRPAGEIAP